MLGMDFIPITGLLLVVIIYSSFLATYLIYFPDQINKREIVAFMIIGVCICLMLLNFLFDWDITQNIQDMLESYLGE